MNRYQDPLTLQQNARRLRHEALAGMGRAAAIKWRTLVALIAEKASAAPTAHAPHPRQVTSQAHP
jgi:hypothetical protein